MDKRNKKTCSKQRTTGNKPDFSQRERGPKTNGPKNDPGWYTISEAIGQAVGSIPFNRFPGARSSLGNTVTKTKSTGGTITAKSIDFIAPGVLCVDYIPSIGSSNDPNSAVNIAAKSIYSWVRHANSGHSNYESSDLMMYILAMADIYSTYLECCRAYKIAMTYTFTNRNIPDLLLQALGFATADLRGNLAMYRYRLNLMAAKISSMAVPDVCDLFKRQALISSQVYSDSTSQMAQFYVFKKDGYFTFDATATTGGKLKYERWEHQTTLGKPITLAKKIAILESCINKMISDEDMNIMSGDILKAYGSEKCYRLTTLDENATIDILYDENILGQIENATCLKFDYDATKQMFDIYQENNIIKSNLPVWSNDEALVDKLYDYSILSGNILFNSHKDNPDWKDILEWTRCTTVMTETESATTARVRCGSEYIAQFEIWRYQPGADEDTTTVVATAFSTLAFDVNKADEMLVNLPIISMFDWHPFLYATIAAGGTQQDETMDFSYPIGDIKKYTIVAADTIANMHDAAIMGELAFNLKA